MKKQKKICTNMRKTTPNCIYCSQQPGSNPDHVPPKSYFEPPRPSNLITVPCCRPCNKGFTKDDDYLRTALSVRDDIVRDPRRLHLQNWRDRSWARSESVPLRRRILQQTFRTNLKMPSGLIIPEQHAFTLETDRVRRVLTRYTKALFYHHKGFPLPLDAQVVADVSFESNAGIQDLSPQFLSGKGWWVLGKDEFRYSWNSAEDEPTTTIWLFVFFNSVPFFTMTMPSSPPESYGLTR